MASDLSGEGFVELREDPPSIADGAFLVAEVGDTTTTFRMGADAFLFLGNGTTGSVVAGTSAAAPGDFRIFAWGDVLAVGDDANLVAFGTGANIWRSDSTPGRVAFWDGPSFFGAKLVDDGCFLFDKDTCTLTVDNISGTPSFSLVPGEVLFGGAGGEIAQNSTFTFDGTTLTATNVQGGSVAALLGAFYDVPEAANVGAMIFIGAASGEYVTDPSGISFDAAGDDLTVGDDVFAGGLVSSDLTTGHVVYATTSGRLATDGGVDSGLEYDAVNDLLEVSGATARMGVRDGTYTRASLDASGDLKLYNATGSQVVSAGSTGEAVFNDTAGTRDFRVESDNNPNMLYVDGTNERVGINDSTPDAVLDIGGSESLRFVPAGETNMFVVYAPDGGLILDAESSKVELDGTFVVFELAGVEAGRINDSGLRTVLPLTLMPQSATISGGSVAMTASTLLLDTEGGAATDDLDSIVAGTGVTLAEGMVINVRQVNGSRDITIKDGAVGGNIQCGSDRTFTTASGVAQLMYDGTNSRWLLISFQATN